MFDSMKSLFVNRRELFRKGGLLAIPGLLRGSKAAAAPPVTGGLRVGPDIYRSIGVRPLINCRGTLLSISCSLTNGWRPSASACRS